MYSDNVMLIKCDVNGKQGTARNIGMMYATGDYISFVDADDRIHNKMYEILYKMIEETKSEIIQFRYKGILENMPDEEINDIEYKIYSMNDPILRKTYILNSKILNKSCTQKIYKRQLLIDTVVRFAEGVSYEEPLFTYPLKFFANNVTVTETPLYYYI